MTQEQIVWMSSDRGLVRTVVRQRHPDQGVRGWLHELTPLTPGIRHTRLVIRLRTDGGGFAFIPAHMLVGGISKSGARAHREGRYMFSRDRHGNLSVLVSAMGTEGTRVCTIQSKRFLEVQEMLERYLGLRSNPGSATTTGANGKAASAP